ncbi:MAG: PQQ-binding-like beta-propeller repeat protein [Planctomycetota bacterium]|nr:PQQ-binding-like beta-propeller repeat protein [Planctomycetota bacterium]
MTRSRRILAYFLPIALASLASPRAEDWPQWRCDAARSAATPASLPRPLHLQWTLHLGAREPVWDDPLNRDMMPYDAVLEPVAAGGRLFVGLNDADQVRAYDLETGAEAWRFYADGPVRLPPAVWEGLAFAASDDGCLYALSAADGKLVWKRRGGPSERKVLGNTRVISSWPARGGPVVRDGVVYFAASIWPFMGTFFHALDAKTGATVWINDGAGSTWMKQPHNAPSFAGVAPQGALAATEKFLVVPGGRSIPAVFDRATGIQKHFHLAAGGKGIGGSFVCAGEDEYYVHTRYRGVQAFELVAGKKVDFRCSEPVLAGPVLYTADTDKEKAQVTRAYDAKDKKLLWEAPVDASGDLILAGHSLIAAGPAQLTALDLPKDAGPPAVGWQLPVQGEVQRLLAAGGRLLAVTRDGRILCYGAKAGEPRELKPEPRALEAAPAALQAAREVVAVAGAEKGYALCLGAGAEALDGLLQASELRLVALEPEAQAAEALRRRYDGMGLYAKRISVHAAGPVEFRAPAYFAHLVCAGRALAPRLAEPDFLEACWRSVRPYGGALWAPLPEAPRKALEEAVAAGRLPQAKLREASGGLLLVREGPLPGAAPWTHQYGNLANTVKSDDRLVKLPLGLLWFGGSSNLDVLPRHGHGPPPMVVGGRLFIEGMDRMNARDVYTGRVLWQTTFENLGVEGIYFDHTHKDTPLSPAYNQTHIPGANARGTNFVATLDKVYVATPDGCHVLDAVTGKNEKLIPMQGADGQPAEWSFIGVSGDVLLGGAGFAHYSRRTGETRDPAKPDTWRYSVDLSGSAGLAAFDRRDGKVLWRLPAKHSFLHNGIVAGGGRVYLLDRLPPSIEATLKRKGENLAEPYRVLAVDLKTGAMLWESSEHVFGSWLGYSEEHDILIQAGARASDRLNDEAKQGLVAYRGKDGSEAWKELGLAYNGPCILHGEMLLTNTNAYTSSVGAFDLRDGSPRLIVNPLTGLKEPLRFTRTYGCNTPIASEHLLTFRSGAAGFFDLQGLSGSGNFGGFKSGCTSNLIAADGVLNAPDYTRTCSCGYQNQTSLALIHMPELEMWTYSKLGDGAPPGTPLRRLGLNLGAPGDRLAENGTLFLDYPSVGGRSPDPPVKLEGENLAYFRRHAMELGGAGEPWIAASGVAGLRGLEVELASREGLSLKDGILVGHSKDDAEEAPDGKVVFNSSDLELVEEAGSQVVALRFTHLPLAREQAIARAWIQFEVDEVSAAPCELLIQAHAADNAPRFKADSKSLSALPRTKAQVAWSPAPWKEEDLAGVDQRTPDLAPLLREILARPGWEKDGAVAFLVTGTGKRVARAFDYEEDSAPRLVVELDEKDAGPAERKSAPHTVRLHFVEPEARGPGERVFDVALQGQRVLERFDPAKEAGAPWRGLVKEFKGVPLAGTLKLEFVPAPGAKAPPVLCGLEVVQE